MHRVRRWLAVYAPVMLSGLLLGLTRLPVHLHFLAFFCLLPLFAWFARGQSIKRTIIAGFVLSAAYTLTALHWLALTAQHAMVPHALEILMGAGIPLGLIILFGAYFAPLFLLIRLAWRSRYRLWLVGGLWLGFEWLQGLGEFRFPWHDLGYTIAPYTVLLQPAELGGVYLVSLLVFAMNALLWQAWRARHRRWLLLAAALLLVWLGYGVWRMQTLPLQDTGVQIGLVQASIPQEQKWDPTYEDENFALYSQATQRLAAAGADLVIWPESAITLPILHTEYGIGQRGQDFVLNQARNRDVHIFTGFPHFVRNTPDDPQYRYKPYLYYNSCTQVTADGVEEPYHKIALVPFGERMPWLSVFPFLWQVQLGQANFEYGTRHVMFEVDSLRYSPLICFEMALPRLTREMAVEGAQVIVNISNDGWFGRSSGTWQHAQMSRYRAIETRRMVYRAANTGVSMIVDPMGRMLARAGMFERKELMASALVAKTLTPFCRGGYLLPVVAGVAALLLTLSTAWRKRHTTDDTA